MSSMVSNPVFQAYAATAIVLGLNLLLLANGTAISRAGAGQVVNPEDKKLNAEGQVVFYEGSDKTQRYLRAHKNALENLPPFLVSALALTFTGVSTTVAAALFGTFTVARILHSICYVGGKQPWRTASFAIGAITQAVLLGFLGYYVFVA